MARSRLEVSAVGEFQCRSHRTPTHDSPSAEERHERATTTPGERCPAGHQESASLWREAAEFLAQFHREELDGTDPAPRVAQVHDEINATGTYRHTTRELAFGARVAWRNATRCIGLAHLDREERNGRQVSAELSWIVPPVSGAATGVFHRTYDPTERRPAYVHHTEDRPPLLV
ncbi:nitric oxide synthase oxygenase [Streptomyces monticola]|uniref:Nitric oxide synthase oxygenase n=1 Tax=Streptomyces monticola TaxID=2666263 RepID=A0ABW2JGV0_9ACTN